MRLPYHHMAVAAGLPGYAIALIVIFSIPLYVLIAGVWAAIYKHVEGNNDCDSVAVGIFWPLSLPILGLWYLGEAIFDYVYDALES